MQKSGGASRPPIVIAAVCCVLFSCAEDVKPKPLPAGSPRASSIRFEYAVYFLPEASADPRPVLARAAQAQRAGPEVVSQPPERPASPVVAARVEQDVQGSYPPPDPDSLRYFGRGLDRDQEVALQASREALVLDFAHSADHALEALQAANRLVEQIARETGGLIWDQETREIFSPDEWRRRRIDVWTEGIPDASTQTTIHAYKNGDYVRSITLGMKKFGLPDIVVEESSWSASRDVGRLLNLFSQALVEGASFEKEGEFDLDLRTIRRSDVRERQLSALVSHATGAARLSVRRGVADEGDPDNALIEITFDRYPGPDSHARRDEMLSTFFGWEDAVSTVRHDDALVAASKRAKSQLPALRRALADGLEPGERILVKAPFDTPSGDREWMWVEVTRWRGSRIEGLLSNVPLGISALHSGQVVEVNEADVFDSLRIHADGRQEGNETGELIEKMSPDANDR